MKEKIKKIVAYIFRSWEDEPAHPRLKILPPIFMDILRAVVIFFILYSVSKWIISLL